MRQALVEQMDVLRCPMRSYRMLLYITVLTYLPCFAFPTRESLNVHSGIVRLSQRFEVFSGTDEEQPAQLSVESQRWRLTRVPEGSWCSSGRTNFESTSPLSVGKLKVTLSKANLTFEGVYKVVDPLQSPDKFQPTTFQKPGADAPKSRKQTYLLANLEKPMDVEVCGDGGAGIVIIRFEKDWRGVTYGPVTGWKFQLNERTLYLVDADLDGKATDKDRVIYDDSKYWMPWHRVTCDQKLHYYDMSLIDDGALSAKTLPLGNLGDDSDVAANWNRARIAYGVPPGVFDPALAPAAKKHADYLKLNRAATHEEDPKLPGYSEEGNLAGLSSLITFEGKDGATERMIGSFYHRRNMIDPTYSTLYVGGNDYAFCLGVANIRTRLQSKLPSESRTMPLPLMSPAPEMAITFTTLGRESPTHPLQKGGQTLGYPVLVVLPGYAEALYREPPTDVKGDLQTVKGSLASGKVTGSVKCYLSYPGFNAPASRPENDATVALTPVEPLKVGVYQASFNFTYLKQTYSLCWRFEVVAKEK